MTTDVVIAVNATNGEVCAWQVAESEREGLQSDWLAKLIAPEIARLREVVASAIAKQGTGNERRAA